VSYESATQMLVEVWWGEECLSEVQVRGPEALFDTAAGVTYAYSAIFINVREFSLESLTSRQHHTVDNLQWRRAGSRAVPSAGVART